MQRTQTNHSYNQNVWKERKSTKALVWTGIQMKMPRLCLSEDTSRPTPSTLGPGMYFALTL